MGGAIYFFFARTFALVTRVPLMRALDVQPISTEKGYSLLCQPILDF